MKIKTEIILAGLIIWLVIFDLLILLGGSSVLLTVRWIVGGSFLLMVPGWLILSIIGINKVLSWNNLLYAVGLSASTLLFGGLFYNQFFPLYTTELAMALNCVISLMIGAVYIWGHGELTVPKITLSWQAAIATIISISTLLLSLIGSIILNNEGPNGIIVGMVVLVGFFVMFVVTYREKIPPNFHPLFLFFLSLSLILMYSLRSSHVIGWDINQEYKVFRLTEAVAHWSMANMPGSAYNACLSITILPTILHKLLGGGGEYILKLFMQVYFAFVPVASYLLYRQYVPKIIAFLSAIFFISQTWFVEQMPALVRQEVAFMFLIVSLLAVFDQTLPKWLRNTFFVIFGFSLVLSHYSTAYAYGAMLIISMAVIFSSKIVGIALGSSLFKRERYISYVAVVAIVSFTLVWYGQLTNTSSSLSSFVAGTISNLSQITQAETIRLSIAQLRFSNGIGNQQELLSKAYTEAFNSKKADVAIESLYKDSTYVPIAVDDRVFLPPMVSSKIVGIIMQISNLNKILLVNLLTILGMLLLLRDFVKRKIYPIDFIALCASAFLLIALTVILPSIQGEYNLTRLFMQMSILFALLAISGGIWLESRLHIRRFAALVPMMILFLFFSLGIVDIITGGVVRITLKAPGGRYDSFYSYDSEMYAARWISEYRNSNKPVYADVIANLRLLAFSDIKADTKVFPTTITKDAYVYLVHANVQREILYLATKSAVLSYKAPTKFLDSEKNLIYANGGAKIYR